MVVPSAGEPASLVHLVAFVQRGQPLRVADVLEQLPLPIRFLSEVVEQLQSVGTALPETHGDGPVDVQVGSGSAHVTEQLHSAQDPAVGAAGRLHERFEGHVEGNETPSRDEKVHQALPDPGAHVQADPQGIGEGRRNPHRQFDLPAGLPADLVPPPFDVAQHVGHVVVILHRFVQLEKGRVPHEIQFHAVHLKSGEDLHDGGRHVLANFRDGVVQAHPDSEFLALLGIAGRVPDQPLGVFEPKLAVVGGGWIHSVVAVHSEGAEQAHAFLPAHLGKGRQGALARFDEPPGIFIDAPVPVALEGSVPAADHLGDFGLVVVDLTVAQTEADGVHRRPLIASDHLAEVLGGERRIASHDGAVVVGQHAAALATGWNGAAQA